YSECRTTRSDPADHGSPQGSSLGWSPGWSPGWSLGWSLGLGVLRLGGLPHRGDVERVALLELDGRSVVLELGDRAVDELEGAAEGVGVSDHVEDVRRSDQLAVDREAAGRR